MKKLLQSTIVRVVCKVLVLAMLATLVPNGLTTKAYAQSGSALGSEPAKRVGVVEFINDSNRFGQIVSKNATSAFVMECNKNDKVFQVEASPEEVQAKMDEMGIRLPASQLDCVAIAKELELDGMIQGFIKSVTVKGSGSNKVATATVAIQYVDAASGEVLMGNTAKGESSARIGFTADEDTLVIEAIHKAINIALFNLSNYSVPKATVYGSEGQDTVMLNAGSRNNLYPGLRMVVMRGAYPQKDPNLEDSTIVTEMRVVGYIEVAKVGSIDAVGKIIKQNVGVKPEDICLGLYNDVYVSQYSPVEEVQNSVNSKQSQVNAKRKSEATNIGYIVLGVAALVGLASLFSAKGDSQSGPSIETTTTPGYLKVSANTNGSITGKIIGLRLYKGDTGEYIEKLNDASTRETYYGDYDGRNDVILNVFNEFSDLSTNEQNKFYAKWIWVKTTVDGEVVGEELSEASGTVKWTKLDAPYNLEPSSSIDANSFEVGEAFAWDCDAVTGPDVSIEYKVEVWDGSNSSNKKTFVLTNKYLSSTDLTTLWNFFVNTGYDLKTFVWRVGVHNTNDTNKNAYTWSNSVQFTVDSLPPAPPTKGMRRF